MGGWDGLQEGGGVSLINFINVVKNCGGGGGGLDDCVEPFLRSSLC